ncbi:aspartic peptidase domain-containing protein [Baffinella frigidus]|nr:aspartic peptidase domain-containing protein [Cryptophyta sp. CCMP2293]|mmetsp:Transcript_24958/g.59532  ORF Transcript_24958/g.59532 Transcript_24958/m.59532 type:complete len:576 (+) Transcript_24958:71-1798(+)
MRVALLGLIAVGLASGKILLEDDHGINSASTKVRQSGGVKEAQQLDSHFWANKNVETYGNHKGRFFEPAASSTFDLIKLNNVNVTFLDNTNLRGYDGADMATLGKYEVKTRMGMIEHCNSRNFDDVDGILGFGWADQPRSAALLKTLTQSARPGWMISSQPFMGNNIPMPRTFAFTADHQLGELHLGGVDPSMVTSDMVMMPMTGENVYGIDIHSITYGGVELLHFHEDLHKKAFVGEFDSGTTCLLLPNTDVKGNFTTSPFGILAREQAAGKQHSLMYKTRDVDGNERTYEMAFTECVEPTDETMIMGDPFFRKWVVMHDLEDLNNRKMGLAPKNPSYKLGATTDRSILTPDHAPQQLPAFMANGRPAVQKIHATRKLRGKEFTEKFHDAKRQMLATSSLGEAHASQLAVTLVDKVAVKSQHMVTYNIQLAIGSPPQPLDVIFDTGSFMLAVFADPPPAGATPLLKSTDKKPAVKPSKGKAGAHPVRGAHPRRGKSGKKGASTREEERPELLQVSSGAWGAQWGYRGGSGSGALLVGMGACGVALFATLSVFAARRRRRFGGVFEVEAQSYGSC